VREEKQPCVYILASRLYGTTYIGVTSDLPKRIYQHRNNLTPGHTSKYAVYRLVHYEQFSDMPTAIAREKQLKNGHRPWKINLITEHNPHWVDLAVGLGLEPIRSSVRHDGP
jgi:putative endonuclease